MKNIKYITNLKSFLHSLHENLIQAPKFCTLGITIYHYRNLDLAVMIAKSVRNILEATKN